MTTKNISGTIVKATPTQAPSHNLGQFLLRAETATIATATHSDNA